eukprot:6186213-Pleurochrysis_carterae.AAC.2
MARKADGADRGIVGGSEHPKGRAMCDVDIERRSELKEECLRGGNTNGGAISRRHTFIVVAKSSAAGTSPMARCVVMEIIRAQAELLAVANPVGIIR